VKIFKATGDGELEDVEATGFSGTPWLSASLFKSASFTEIFAFLLTPEGALRIFAMSELEKPCYVAEALCFLPPMLTMDYAPKRGNAKATITEILAADIGDVTTKSPHLIVSFSRPEFYIWLLTASGPNIERQPRRLQSLPFSITISFRPMD
jgi:cleavage and polyadenylation specificity factor subunit 1